MAESVAVTAEQRKSVLAAGSGGLVVTGKVLKKADSLIADAWADG